MSPHKPAVVDSILSLHQHIGSLHKKFGNDALLKKIDDFMLSLHTVGLMDGVSINGKKGRYFLIDAKSWLEASRKLGIEAAPDFIVWEESEFFSFLDSLLKPLGSRHKKQLVNS